MLACSAFINLGVDYKLLSSEPYLGECGGLEVEPWTPKREVRGSISTPAVLCP